MSFESTIEDIDEVTKKIKISVSADKLGQEIQRTMSRVSQQAVIKGFRPGKAPKELVEKLHGESVRADVTRRLIQESLSDCIKEKKFDVVGTPEVDLSSYEAGKNLEFTAQVSLFPAPEVQGYQGLKVSVKKRSVSDKDVEEVLGRVRESKATMRKIEDRKTVAEKDIVDLSLSVEVEGEQKTRPEPVVTALGEKKLPEVVEKELIGVAVGTQKQIETTLGADHPDSRLRGKKVTYGAEVNAIFEKMLPTLDDELVKSMNLGVETVEALKERIQKDLGTENERQSRVDVQAAILDKLNELNSFKVPQVLVDDEIRVLLVRAGFMDEKRAQSADIEPFRKELNEVALKRVKSAVIVDRVGEKEGIKATQEHIDKEISAIADRSGVSIEEAKKYLLSRERMVGFLMEISRNLVIDYLISKTEVSYTAE